MSTTLAKILKNKKETIISEWEIEVKAVVPASRLEKKAALRNSIPHFIDDLVIALDKGLSIIKPDMIEFAHMHGSERAHLSEYSIEDALSEYGILRKVIFRNLEKEKIITPEERDIIIESIDFGMKKAGAEYAKQSQKELNVLFELAGTGKAVIDPTNGNYLKVNQAFCMMLGYSKEELSHKNIFDLTHPDDRKKQMELLKSHNLQTERWSIVKRYVRKNGTSFWVEVFSSPLPETPSHPYRNICTYIDVTNKIMIEKDQKKNQIKLQKITDIQPSLIGHVDKNLHYLFVNMAYERWFRVPVQEITGKHIRELVGEKVFAIVEPYFKKALAGERVTFQAKFEYPNMNIMSAISTYSPSFDENGKVDGVYISVNDITEQQKNLENLKRSESMRDRFISALSHDLRTPLTSAILSAQLIPRKSSDTAVTTLSKKIEMSLKRVDKMIEDLLDANRLRAGQKINLKIQELDLSSLVRSTVQDLETIYGDRFVVDIPESYQTYLSSQNIRRIIENLCTNAIKYGSTSAPVSIFIQPEHEKFILGVKNFGNPLTDTKNLFDQFVRKTDAESNIKGWGIGLAIVKGVTEAHGGEVFVESDEEGTTFKILLPVDARPFTGQVSLH